MARQLIGNFKGDTGYVHIVYSEHADGTGFVSSPTENTNYIGVYTGLLATAPTDKAQYTWLKTIGNPGSGWEKRFIQIPVLGDLSTGTVKMMTSAPFDLTIVGVKAKVLTAPTGASLIIDINKQYYDENDHQYKTESLYTTQANRPTIADGNNAVDAALPDIVTLLKDEIVFIDIDQVGSTTPGSNIVVTLECEV